MRKVCFFINTLGASGGTQKMLVFLANLICDNFETIIYVKKQEKSFYRLNPNIKIHVDSNLFINYFLQNLKIYKFCIKQNVDFFVNLDSNTYLLNGFILPNKTKLIIWEHFSLESNSPKLLFRLSRWFALKNAFKFVLLSEYEFQLWKTKYSLKDSKLEIINNPITIKSVGTDNNLFLHKKFIAIGNNIDVKGFDLLIEAWSKLKPKDWALEIIGLDDLEIEKLKIKIDELKLEKISLTKRLLNIEQKYNSSSVFCLTSRKEAYPLVLIESQAKGLPAILFDSCSGALEIIKDSNSSIIVKSFDTKKYSDVMQKFIDNQYDYKQLSVNSVNNGLKFNPHFFKKKWLNIFNK